MFLNGAVRQYMKHSLSVAKVKLLDSPKSFHCGILRLCHLDVLPPWFFQILGLIHDSEAVSALSNFVQKSNFTSGLAILKDDTVKLCSGLPNEQGTVCKHVVTFENGSVEWHLGNLHFDKDPPNVNDDEGNLTDSLKTRAADEDSVDKSQGLGDNCYVSLKWLNDVLHDDQREDVVTFLFQIWLFILSFVTIMNESIPHLGAALFGNMLSTGWAGYRVYSTYNLMNLYRTDIKYKACNGHDLMGDWWEERLSDTIPLVACDAVALLAMTFLSFKLYKVRLRPSNKHACRDFAKVLRLYKSLLARPGVFCLPPALGFISFASTGLWIDKVVHGSLAEFSSHTKGWICVRKECNVRFTLFCLISLLLLGTSIAMFASDLYRYIFSTWPFFATITVTSFLFLVGTTVLAVICRLNFGQGLAHYRADISAVQVNDALEGVDFTPVYFTKPDLEDIEKSSPSDVLPEPQSLAPPKPIHLSKPRGDSIYSDVDAAPIILSASPPLTSDLGPVPNSLAQAESPRSPSIMTTSTKRPSQLRIVTGNTKELLARAGGDSGSAKEKSPRESLSALSYVSEEPSSTTASGDIVAPTRRLGSGKPGLPTNPRSGLTRI
ncbi:hypothetical protein CPB84DRAFT_1743449 [Gymnopilus junonius]|uniref:Transmembrane protein n=1 Tax=Gymnopilus junonius TaxID=109634 RepID=A0A9P5P132_GYMJU|nr:hypothetical protein CPB84DRAFT_1743449 [Gymnopilus junonius]